MWLWKEYFFYKSIAAKEKGFFSEKCKHFVSITLGVYCKILLYHDFGNSLCGIRYIITCQYIDWIYYPPWKAFNQFISKKDYRTLFSLAFTT